ncbi:MAG TPA: hypothetical protein VMP08_17210 [Anaerolineae bacterium]|nr:hypothetical protein [Anaerolineae bacterium]
MADSYEAIVAQHNQQPSTSDNQQQEPYLSSQAQQNFQLRHVMSDIRVAMRASLRNVGRNVFGDEQGGPALVVEQILNWLVLGLGDEPTSRAGRVMRQLLAAAWLMLCVLMLANFAQADRAGVSMRVWSIFYGSLGFFYLMLWLILVVGFVRERRAWARN